MTTSDSSSKTKITKRYDNEIKDKTTKLGIIKE